MSTILEKFEKLGVDNAPGQEVRQKQEISNFIGDNLEGRIVDFSHGDVDAFPPLNESIKEFVEGFEVGGAQAYTEYRGKVTIREELAKKLSNFTGSEIEAEKNMILTPGTQGALFLAMGALVGAGDKVAIVEPDYFANRKLVEFFDGELVSIHMDYMGYDTCAGLNLEELEKAFQEGVKLFLFSNPNNPTGVIYSKEEIITIAALAEKYHVTLLVDELYSRQLFDERGYTHLCGQNLVNPESVITILGPSKTESLSGFRLGVAFGSASIIQRMEKLQAIVSLRCAGYNQAVFSTWFSEPDGWMPDRIAKHQAIRDDLVALFRSVDGVEVRVTEGGSYMFPKVTGLKIPMKDFVKALRVQAGVIVTPGTEFGPEYTESFRLNFSQDPKAAHDAIVRVVEMIKRYRA